VLEAAFTSSCMILKASLANGLVLWCRSGETSIIQQHNRWSVLQMMIHHNSQNIQYNNELDIAPRWLPLM
jgi:hypothetical protein